MVTSKKGKKLALIVYNDDVNSYESVVKAFVKIIGYDVTQAANCAHIIHHKGEYIVKTYSIGDKHIANAILDLLTDHNIAAELIII